MPDRLELRNVTYFQNGIPVLRKVNLSAQKGEVLIVGGRSGHGKSTLLEICASLIRPHSGKVFWDGEDVNMIEYKQLLIARHEIGFVFQIPALISNFTAFENIALPLRVRKVFNEEEINFRVRVQMEKLGLFNIDKKYPETLSTVQLRAVSTARALIGRPKMLLLDEVLSGLDAVSARGILNVLNEYREMYNPLIILVTDNYNDRPVPVRRIFIHDGILAEGNQRNIMEIADSQTGTGRPS